jgi:DNA polymerase-3 subunit beta
MDLSIQREDVVQGLYFAQGVVERRNTLPILANVLMDATKDSLLITATDMEVGVRRRCPATVKTQGAVTLNARKLYEIVREIPADTVTMRTVGDGFVELRGGRSRFRMVSLDPKDFPDLPFGTEVEGAKLRLTGALLLGMIDRTIFSVSTDETRFNLSGVLFEVSGPGEVRMIGTDGHRLAMVTRTVAGAEPGQVMIVPRKGLLELKRLLDSMGEQELELCLSQKELRMRDASVELFMRAIEGEFPDYRQVLPKETTNRARVARDEMLSAVRRVALVASERSRGVKLQIEPGKLDISASSPDLGEANEELEIDYKGDAITVGFNARYLVDVLSVHSEGGTIELGLTDAVGPGTIKSDDDPEYTYVLMPMRL